MIAKTLFNVMTNVVHVAVGTGRAASFPGHLTLLKLEIVFTRALITCVDVSRFLYTTVINVLCDYTD